MPLSKILRDRYMLGYAGLYLLSLLVLVFFEDYGIGEAVSIAVIFGLFLPIVAYWSCRLSKPIGGVKESSNAQIYYLVLCMVVVALVLAIGPDYLVRSWGVPDDSRRLAEIFKLLTKLLVFVIVPGVLFAGRFGLRSRDFGLELRMKRWLEKKQFRALLVLIPLMLLFQLFAGQAAAPIRTGTYSATQLLWGLPLAFVWLLIEVGLVEEFFFRSLVQSRVAAHLKSEAAGIVIAGLLFGLAHAPGLYLRGAGANSDLGTDPSLLLSVGYSIVVLSAAGLFLGIVWSRTRNLLLVMLIHAAVDLLPNFDEFAHVWGLTR